MRERDQRFNFERISRAISWPFLDSTRFRTRGFDSAGTGLKLVRFTREAWRSRQCRERFKTKLCSVESFFGLWLKWSRNTTNAKRYATRWWVLRSPKYENVNSLSMGGPTFTNIRTFLQPNLTFRIRWWKAAVYQSECTEQTIGVSRTFAFIFSLRFRTTIPFNRVNIFVSLYLEITYERFVTRLVSQVSFDSHCRTISQSTNIFVGHCRWYRVLDMQAMYI